MSVMRRERWFCLAGGFRLAAVFLFLLSFIVSGQETLPAAAKDIPDASAEVSDSKTPETPLAERQSLAAEMSGLLKSGAGPDEIVRWHEKNSERLADLQQRIVAMAEERKTVITPLVPVTARQEGISKAAGELLDKRAELQNSRAELMNRMSGATPSEIRLALETWRRDNAGKLDSLRVVARQAGDESGARARQAPASYRIPPGASPVLESFLKERFQLRKERAEHPAGHLEDPPELRQQSEDDWLRANQTRIQALQLKASQLSEEKKSP